MNRTRLALEDDAYTVEQLIELAKGLRADHIDEDAKRLLPPREYECWRHTELDGWTAYRTASYMGISVRSVMYALRRARLSLGTWHVEQQEGEIKFGLTIVEGGQPKFAVDETMTGAHRGTRTLLTARAIDAIGDVEEDLDAEIDDWMEAAA